jgi:RNA polymerase sigma-70 factor (ECF subfamily)
VERPCPDNWDWPRLREGSRREALRILRNPEDADDATQQAMVRAWRSRRSCRTPEAPLAWCVAIARNEAFRVLQQKKVRPVLTIDDDEQLDPPDPSATDRFDDSLRRLDVLDALRRSSEQDSRLVLLRYVADYSNAQIANAMGIPEATARVNLHRARNRLRELLEGDA